MYTWTYNKWGFECQMTLKWLRIFPRQCHNITNPIINPINSVLHKETGLSILLLLSLQKGRRRQELVFSEAHKVQWFENLHPTSKACGAAEDSRTTISGKPFSPLMEKKRYMIQVCSLLHWLQIVVLMEFNRDKTPFTGVLLSWE